MRDGSRHFASVPNTRDARALREHIGRLVGATLATEDVTDAWLDFEYRGHHFAMNEVLQEWWLFVTDPACPDEILQEVVGYVDRA